MCLYINKQIFVTLHIVSKRIMNTIYKILIVALFFTIITNCKKESPSIPNCGQRFYYYNNQKIYLYVSKSKITVGFKDTLTFQEMKQILDQYTFISPLQQEQAVLYFSLHYQIYMNLYPVMKFKLL